MIRIVKVSSLLTFKDNKVLLVRSKKKWTLPGGKIKIKKGEKPKECLKREIEREELPYTILVDIKRFARLPNEITPHSKSPLDLFVFKGKVIGPIVPGREVKEARWFSLKEIEEAGDKISKATKKAIRKSGLK